MSFILLQKIKNVIKFQLNRYSLINNLKKKNLSLKKKSLFFWSQIKILFWWKLKILVFEFY